MLYIPGQSTDCYFNLALEEYVFSHLDPLESYFMLWQNENTIVVGKHQNTVEEICAEYVETHGIHVVRRLSGGGAVYHDLGNLNFTFITQRKGGMDFAFRTFALPVIHALQSLGIQAEFNSRNDLAVNGRKFSGNAQFLRGNRILHHGTLLFDSDLTVLSQALSANPKKFASKSVKSTQSRVTNLSEHLKTPITLSEFQDVLLRHVFSEGSIPTYTLTEADRQAVKCLRDKKYVTWDWNYGKSPPYSVRREQKFPGGQVTVYFEVSKGRLTAIKFYGDFFGAETLQPLECGLIGTPLERSALYDALISLDAPSYFSHISAHELCSLILS